MKIILSTTRIFCWKVPSNRPSVETLVIVIIINSSMFYYQFNTHLLMENICWQIATTRWPLLLNYTQTGNTKIQKKSYHTFCVFKDFSSFPIGVDRTFNLGTFFATTLVYKNQSNTKRNQRPFDFCWKVVSNNPVLHSWWLLWLNIEINA